MQEKVQLAMVDGQEMSGGVKKSFRGLLSTLGRPSVESLIQSQRAKALGWIYTSLFRRLKICHLT